MTTPTSSAPPKTLKATLALYADRRLAAIFVLGFASGFPWVLIGSAMTAWLQEAGLSRTAIGLFGSIFVAYTVNFAWSPLVDRWRLPGLGVLGQRRSWIVATQGLMLLGVLAISWGDPRESLWLLSAVALSIAVASATQDVAIDAYRIEIIGRDEPAKMPPAAAMATAGWWTGYSLPGALALTLADLPAVDWGMVYGVLAGVLAALMAVVVGLLKEPPGVRDPRQGTAPGHPSWREMWAWWVTTFTEPFREFFVRNGWRLALAILGFVVLFKVGEAFLGRMSIVFYKEIGFSNTEIAAYSKVIGWWVIIVFAVVGSAINAHFGLVRGLFIGGVAMAASNLLFALLAVTGPVPELFVLAVVVDNFTTAFSTVAFVAFISHLTSRLYTATQYAALASLGNLGRTLLASASGAMVDGLAGDWATFFVVTALMVTPGLMLLLRIGRAATPALRPAS
ncbi:MAG: MFS transporter [Candidatus Competibacterales bacterium]